MPNQKSTLVNASILLCETVLLEETANILSAIRIMDVLTLSAHTKEIRFFVLTLLHSQPKDVATHILKIQMVGWANGNWKVVGEALPHGFTYGYRQGADDPGAFTLQTQFNLTLAELGSLGVFYVQAWLDGELVAQTPLKLRRS